MKRINLIAVLMVGMIVFSLTACRSGKQLTDAVPDLKGKETEWATKATAEMIKTGVVTSKMNLQLSLDGKNISVSGNCHLKKDELIQMSLVLLGFMEVGRLEFTPDYVMLVNRAERQYVKINYADIPYLQQAGVDFYSLQALFWADIFVPGKASAWEAGDFKVVSGKDSWTLTTSDRGLLSCRFVVDALSGLLRNSTVMLSDKAHAPLLNWTYQRFTATDGGKFPDKMFLEVGTSGKSVFATFSLSNVKWNTKSVSPTQEPTGKYQKVDTDTILKQLMKL